MISVAREWNWNGLYLFYGPATSDAPNGPRGSDCPWTSGCSLPMLDNAGAGAPPVLFFSALSFSSDFDRQIKTEN